MSDDSPKIFVDEDWKARVQREREEAARKAEEAAKAQAAAPAAPATAPEAAPGHHAPAGALPEEPFGPEGEEGPLEANFSTLVASLTTQAMFALGMIPQPGQDQLYVNLDQAAFTLETLAMLAEKTKGNLTPEEEAYLGQALTELERVFQARIAQFQQQAMKEGGLDPGLLR